jgi:hypothetical protein
MTVYTIIKEIYQLFAISAFTIGALRWFTKQIAFNHELKNNHLKHINHYLILICKKLDIPYDEGDLTNG